MSSRHSSNSHRSLSVTRDVSSRDNRDDDHRHRSHSDLREKSSRHGGSSSSRSHRSSGDRRHHSHHELTRDRSRCHHDSRYDGSNKRSRDRDSDEDEMYESLTAKKQKRSQLKAQEDSSEEEDDDDDEGEWVIKADSGDYIKPQAPAQPRVTQAPVQAPAVKQDINNLNKLKSAILRAKLKKESAESIAKLEQEYEAELAKAPGNSTAAAPTVTVLDSDELRMYHELTKKSAEEGGAKGDTTTVTDMLREELAERNAPVLGAVKRTQELKQIGKDSAFQNDSDYQFDNADVLVSDTAPASGSDKNTKRQQKEEDKREETRKKLATRILEHTKFLDDIVSHKCFLCPESQRHEKYLNPPMKDHGGHSSSRVTNKIISASPRVYMARAPAPALTRGTCVIVPREHRANLLHCDEDEWDEVRNYMKCLVRMWVEGKKYAGVAFYENAVAAGLSASEDASASQGQRDLAHACLYAVPVRDPYDLKDLRAMFKEAMLTSDEEWSTHRKVIDTQALAAAGDSSSARFAFRKAISKEAPYFHVWLDINGGLGHIVEDRSKWPRGDLFAREVLGNLLRTDITKIRRTPRWENSSSENDKKIWEYQTIWDKYDWAKDLE